MYATPVHSNGRPPPHGADMQAIKVIVVLKLQQRDCPGRAFGRWVVALEFVAVCTLALAVVGDHLPSMRPAFTGLLAVTTAVCTQSADSFLAASEVQVRVSTRHCLQHSPYMLSMQEAGMRSTWQ
mgnify:CR=1 FL=1